jgi:hypothetical protein
LRGWVQNGRDLKEPPMPTAPDPTPKDPTPDAEIERLQQAEDDLSARIDALETAAKPKRPKPPPIGSMF